MSQHPVKPTIGRPSSKPRSYNPLLNSIRLSGDTGTANSSSDNSSPVEETAVLSRRNNKIRTTIDTELLKDKVQVHNGLPPSGKVKQLDAVMRNSQDTWREDFDEDIYEDEYEGNSLCSSAASLLYKEHEFSKNGDLVSSSLW